jgi:hypothetical protein
MTEFTNQERALLYEKLKSDLSDYHEGSLSWNLLEKTLSALALPGPVTISAPSAPGSESASTESAISSVVEEGRLWEAAQTVMKYCDSFNWSQSEGLARWTCTFEVKPPMAATASGPSPRSAKPAASKAAFQDTAFQ